MDANQIIASPSKASGKKHGEVLSRQHFKGEEWALRTCRICSSEMSGAGRASKESMLSRAPTFKDYLLEPFIAPNQIMAKQDTPAGKAAKEEAFVIRDGFIVCPHGVQLIKASIFVDLEADQHLPEIENEDQFQVYRTQLVSAQVTKLKVRNSDSSEEAGDTESIGSDAVYERFQRKSIVAKLARILFIATVLAASLAVFEQAALLQERTLEDAATSTLTWVDFQIVISFGFFLACLGVVIYENCVHWRRYGIFIHNGFIEMSTGQYKWEPFFSSVCGILFFIMALLLISEKCFGRLHFLVEKTDRNNQQNGLINWPLVFVAVPAFLLIMRHFLYKLRISTMQGAGLFVSLGALCVCLRHAYRLECGENDCQNFYVFHEVTLSVFLALLMISMKHTKTRIGFEGETGESASAPYRSQLIFFSVVHFIGTITFFLGFTLAEVIRNQEKNAREFVPEPPFNLRPLTLGLVFTDRSLLLTMASSIACGAVLFTVARLLDQPEFKLPISTLAPLALVPIGMKFCGSHITPPTGLEDSFSITQKTPYWMLALAALASLLILVGELGLSLPFMRKLEQQQKQQESSTLLEKMEQRRSKWDCINYKLN